MQVGRWLVVFGVLASTWGCSSSKDDDAGATATGASVMSTGGASAEPAKAPCGGAICSPFTGPGLTAPLQACCADQFTQKCGVQIGASCMKAPEPHPTCASVQLGPVGVAFGCCAENKRCGLTGLFFGDTCRDLDAIKAGSMMMMMGPPGFFMLPEPSDCQ